MSGLVKFEDLQSITGYERAGDIEQALRSQGIKFFHGKAKTVWTTMDLINAAGGAGGNKEQRDIKIK
jgi:hypothetical protein